MLSIFCSYRNRPDMLEDFIEHYRTFFPDAVIYILEQDDQTAFKRGQLMNVAFNKISEENVVLDNMMFVDVDIRMLYKIDFEDLLRKHRTVVIPYNKLSLCYLRGRSIYEPENKPSYFLDIPDGGLILFTKEQFQQCNGFSNLYIGWGREDSDFVRRNKITRIPNSMIHLWHERNKEWTKAEFKRNDYNFNNMTNFSLDGFRQTVANAVMIKGILKNLFYCKIRDIRVVSDYIYKNRFAAEVL